MDKLTWFKFKISDWMMGKIQKCPEVTQARFMRLICLYWNKECVLSFDDAEIEIDIEHLNILIAKKIVVNNGEFINIKFLDEQNNDVSDISQKRKDAVNARWEKSKSNTSVSKLNTSVLQNDTEKRREDKNRIDNNISEEQRVLISDICSFFGYTSIDNKSQQSLTFSFVYSLPHKGKLDFVIKEFKAYTELKKLDGYKHSLENFLGKQSEQFIGGKWDDNWTLKLNEYKAKNGISTVEEKPKISSREKLRLKRSQNGQ